MIKKIWISTIITFSSILLLLLLYKKIQIKPINNFNLNPNEISSIEIFLIDSNEAMYSIDKKKEIEYIIDQINTSKKVDKKFGSRQTLKIYDLDRNEIFNIAFGHNTFAIFSGNGQLYSTYNSKPLIKKELNLNTY